MSDTAQFKGVSVSAGIGIGKAYLLNKKDFSIPLPSRNSDEGSVARLSAALESIKTETRELIDALPEGSDTRMDILEAYLSILEDSTLLDRSIQLITEEGIHETNAVQRSFADLISVFESMDDEYLRERASDIRDIRDRILMKLLNMKAKDLNNVPENSIIVASELTTSDTANMKIENISGMLTSTGGINSHASIIARNYEFPAITGIGSVIDQIKDGDLLILNGSTGEFHISPDNNLLDAYTKAREDHIASKYRLEKYRNTPGRTAEGQSIHVCANVGTPDDIGKALYNSAEGVGLFRTEFLFMQSSAMPDEEHQFDIYRNAAEGMAGKPVIIRTLDIGGDKGVKCFNIPKEDNPFLGFRAIRVCLAEKEIFRIQIRAVLRASAYGDIRIMIPMIATLEELLETKAYIEKCKSELTAEGIPFRNDIPLGIMIEVPAAVMIADELAAECDFFSIGTNDLIQYSLAADRGNDKISYLYSNYHPSVIRMIAKTIKAAHDKGIKCGMCGEAAGDPLLIPLLAGLGLDEFSMSSSLILKAKDILASHALSDMRNLSGDILEYSLCSDVENRLKIFANVT